MQDHCWPQSRFDPHSSFLKFMATNVNGRFSGIGREREKYCHNGMLAVFESIGYSSELNIANTDATPITLTYDLKITGGRFTINENGCRAKTLAVVETSLVEISALGMINGVQQSGELRRLHHRAVRKSSGLLHVWRQPVEQAFTRPSRQGIALFRAYLRVHDNALEPRRETRTFVT